MRHPDPDLPHVVVYTSGTESTAKGCVHTWNTLDFSGRVLAHDVLQTRPSDVVFMPSPIAHATGLFVGVLVPLSVGAASSCRTNISAADVEGYVAAHPDVAQVAVIAYPDERLGEKVCAVVVPKPGATPTLQDITVFLKDRRISMQKLPERLLLIDELPNDRDRQGAEVPAP